MAPSCTPTAAKALSCVALAERGASGRGVEPAGAVALCALEQGCAVTIGEASEHLTGVDAGALGGVVLSGVVDRLPLHALLPLCPRAEGRWPGRLPWW